MSQKVIIDTDIGTDLDDAAAIALALASPEIDIVGITTVYTDVIFRAHMVHAMLALAERPEVPVRAGVSAPLLRKTQPHWGGHEGRGLSMAPESGDVHPQHAVDFIIETVLDSPGEISLVAIGPLTNVALALIKEPRIAYSLKQLIIMGGASRMLSNAVEVPVVEWNMQCDPDAADIVFRAGTLTTLVTFDVTAQTHVSEDTRLALKTSHRPVSEALADMMRATWDAWGVHGSPLHDALAVATLIRPEVIETAPMVVHCATEAVFRGQTTITPATDTPGVNVSIAVDRQSFMELFVSRLT